jgi:enoyl-CoA hydratase/carnithine racemase
MNDVVRLEQDGPLAVLTIDSPPLNLFDTAVFDGFRAAIDRVAADPPRGLLIRAEGKVVSGGVDVGKVFDGMSPQDGGQLWDDLLEVIHTIEELPLPTVFAAHGLCLTAAFEIALACDILLASEKAKFGLVEIVVGLTPSMGGPQRLAERAGPARAKELIYTGELYDAATLERWNVVNRVYAPESFADEAHAFATKIANGPTRAHAATKQIVRAQKEGGARAADAIVGEVSGALFATEDLKNAVRSFLEDGPGKATYEGR